MAANIQTIGAKLGASQPIGIVTSASGTVIATALNGATRALQVGDPVYANEVISTGHLSTVAVEFVDGTRLDLGRDSQALLDEEVFNPGGADSADTTSTVEAIQQAILAGKDPTKVFEKPAAGESEGSVVDNQGHGSFLFQLERTNQQTTPESGGQTQGRALSSSPQFDAPKFDDLLFTTLSDVKPVVINGAPFAQANILSVTEDGAPGSVTGNVLINDTDPDSDQLTVTQINGQDVSAGATVNGMFGVLAISSDGSYSYVLNAAMNALTDGDTRIDTFTYSISDGRGGASTSTLSFTISGANDAPVASVASTSGAEDATSIAITLTGSDIDGTIASVTLNTLPGNGLLYTDSALTTLATSGTAYAGGAVTFYFVPNANYNGVVSFDYTLTDSQGLSNAAPATASINVTSVNDAAVITGTASATLTESNAIQSTGGSLTASDVDSSAAFGVQTNVAGSNGYGVFSINAAGVWSYTMGSAHDEFVAGTNYTDSLTVATSDGTTQVISVTLTGTNDAAVITGTASATLTESNAIQSTGGSLSASDVDSSNAFIAQTGVAGSNGYGVFSINAAGVWSYTMGSAHNEFVGGQSYTDSLTVATSDGTTQVISVTMTGTNDAALITGTASATLTESNAIQSTGGTLSATDVDSSAAFGVQTNVAGSNGYGVFSINAAGVWSYTMNSAHDEFVAGTNYTDSLTVATADGTTQVISVTLTGTNDAAVITGTASGSVVEAGGVANGTVGTPTATGTLTDTDVDNTPNTFQVVAAGTASSGGYGTYQMSAAGVWTYTLNNSNASVQALNSGGTLTDTFTVLTADGTAQTVTITITGTNDAAVISGTSTASLTESNAAQSTGGSLSA
ncbi:MAG: retention module-containing protein, partial [Gammaproteobacteria bacterium]